MGAYQEPHETRMNVPIAQFDANNGAIQSNNIN